MQDLFEQTPFADRADCLARQFERNGLNRYSRWQNAPAVLGNKVCGEDVYSVVAALNEAYDQPTPTSDVPELVEDPGPEPDPQEEEVEADTSVFELVNRGVSESQARALASAGWMTIEQLQGENKNHLKKILQEIDGIGEATVNKILTAAEV